MNKITKFFHKLNDRLSTQEKINFARHLAIVIKAGLPIYEGLRIIKNQAASKVLTRIIEQLMTDVNNGRFLADSLEEFEHVFGTFFINIIRVGEASGTLSQNLLYLAEELRKSRQLQSKVKSAMVYPLVILIATIGVTGFLAFYIFPKLLPMLSGLNVKLPPSTMALIAAIGFLRAYGVYLLIGVIGIFIAIKILTKESKMVKYILDYSIFFIPAVAPLVVAVNMVNFTRVLAMLLKSGVKIVEAVRITANTFDNIVYHRMLDAANEEIKKGGQLAGYLITHRKFFPPLLSGMIEVGENTGNLEDNLFYLSEYYDEEVDNKLHNMTSLLEPVMLLFMGLLVGFVAISLITPIYSLSQGVK